MHPLTAERVIAARLAGTPSAGDERSAATILDPFCGSGAVAVEALRAGCRFVGGDVSPVALEIAWVRTRRWPAARCRGIEAGAARAARVATDLARAKRRPPRWVFEESSWYDRAALRDVWALRDAVESEKDADLRRVLRMVLSSILVKVSRQASDATTVRDIDHRPVRAGTAIHLFRRRAHELAGQLNALREDLDRRGVRPPEPHLVQADARTAGLVEPRTAALVLSSPPYLGTYDYLFHHARRYAALGLPTEFADRHEIGARRRARAAPATAIEAYAKDMTAALARMKEAVRECGSIVLLLGDGTVGKHVVRADELIRRIASEIGLAVVAIASQRRPNWLTARGAPSRSEHLIELR